MYENIDDLERDFNKKMDLLKSRVDDAESLARELMDDSIWEEEDKNEVRGKFFDVMLVLTQLSEMFR